MNFQVKKQDIPRCPGALSIPLQISHLPPLTEVNILLISSIVIYVGNCLEPCTNGLITHGFSSFFSILCLGDVIILFCAAVVFSLADCNIPLCAHVRQLPQK